MYKKFLLIRRFDSIYCIKQSEWSFDEKRIKRNYWCEVIHKSKIVTSSLCHYHTTLPGPINNLFIVHMHTVGKTILNFHDEPTFRFSPYVERQCGLNLWEHYVRTKKLILKFTNSQLY